MARDARRSGPEQPPDDGHVWLRTHEVAELMGVNQPAISQRPLATRVSSAASARPGSVGGTHAVNTWAGPCWLARTPLLGGSPRALGVTSSYPFGIASLEELGHGRPPYPVGVLGARPAVLADQRAVNGRVHEHQSRGRGAVGG